MCPDLMTELSASYRFLHASEMFPL